MRSQSEFANEQQSCVLCVVVFNFLLHWVPGTMCTMYFVLSPRFLFRVDTGYRERVVDGRTHATPVSRTYKYR